MFLQIVYLYDPTLVLIQLEKIWHRSPYKLVVFSLELYIGITDHRTVSDNFLIVGVIDGSWVGFLGIRVAFAIRYSPIPIRIGYWGQSVQFSIVWRTH